MKDLKELKKKGQYVILKEYMTENIEEERHIRAYLLLKFQEIKEMVTAYNYRFTIIGCYAYDFRKNEFCDGTNEFGYNKYWNMYIKSIKDKYLNDKKILAKYYYYLPISNIPKYFNYTDIFELVSVFPIEASPKEAKLIWKLFESELNESELKEERKC